MFYSKLKWQFPRRCMDYDFKPRRINSSLVEHFINKKPFILLDKHYAFTSDKYNIIDLKTFYNITSKHIDEMKVTSIGCLIELIKRSTFVISDLKTDVGRLSLLLKKPLIYPQRNLSYDTVSLLNPYKTPIIDCETASKGVKYYENNF